MRKQKIEKLGTHYLLGVLDGETIWLQKPSWECGWYWGFGYVHTFTNKISPERSRDISSHTHFKALIKDGPDPWLKLETPFTEKEKWAIADLLKSAYALQEAAKVFHLGNSHWTSERLSPYLKQEDIEQTINQNLLPAIFESLEKILSPEE